jgi:hypothetical protein
MKKRIGVICVLLTALIFSYACSKQSNPTSTLINTATNTPLTINTLTPTSTATNMSASTQTAIQASTITFTSTPTQTNIIAGTLTATSTCTTTSTSTATPTSTTDVSLTVTPTCGIGGVDNEIQNLIVSPATVSAGQNITITFQLSNSSTGCKLQYFVALSNNCYIQPAGTSGQIVLVSEAGMNVLNSMVISGRASQCVGDGTWHNNTDASCGMEPGGAPVYMTVPSTWARGTYYVIVPTKSCNVYLNPLISADQIAFASFTVQ